VSEIWSLDAAPFDCSLPALMPVTWPGLAP
jgi:hypothetical protein